MFYSFPLLRYVFYLHFHRSTKTVVAAITFETPTLIQGQFFLCELACLVYPKKNLIYSSGSDFYFHLWKRESEWLAKNKNRNIVVCVWIFKLNYYIPCFDLYAVSKLNFTRSFWERNEMNSEIETLAINHVEHAVDKE